MQLTRKLSTPDTLFKHYSVARNNSLHRCNRQLSCAASKQDPAADTTTQEVTVSQALTAIGLSGTIAVSGAAFCGINLSSLFNWQHVQDIQLALELNSILLLLDAALFLPRYNIPDVLLEPSSSPQQQQQQQQQQLQRSLDVSAVSSCSAWDPRSWAVMLAMLRSAIRKPQLQQLPLPLTAGLLVGREGSKELLQRGFLITALAGWLSDRLYEADVGSLEGLVTLPGGVQATLPQLGLWAAALAATALFAPTAFLAAEEAAEGVSGAMLLRTEAGEAVAAAAAAKSRPRGSSAAASKVAASSSTGTQQSNATRQAAAGATELDDDDDEESEPLDPEVLEYRLVKVTQSLLTSAPTQLAYRITLAKELGRLMLANVVFVATQQNLAASFTSSLVANALLLLYSRLGQQEQAAVQQQSSV